MAGKENGRGSRHTSRMRWAVGALAFLASAIAAGQTMAEDCARLRAAIDAAPRGGANAQAAAAAARQRSELARTSAYANQIGCNNQKFLFFGADPPAQCGEIKGQIARMESNLAELQGRSGGGRDELVARYNANCVNAAQPQQPSNIFEALFGGGARPQQRAYEPEMMTPDEQQQSIENSIEKEKKGANVSAGGYAVCVRTCDGSFFPVSYGGASGRLEDVCRSLCPNADMQLYSFPFGGTIEQAVSVTGERYVDMPNALKFQQSYDATCSCRRRGESWAETLAAAEAKYGHEAKDILVTPQKSIELSRPIIAKASADPKAKPKPTAPTLDATTPAAAATATPATGAPAAGADPSLAGGSQSLNANGEDTALSAAAANVSREASGIAGGSAQSGTFYNQAQGRSVTETGPDGATKTVRIVGPAL
jgi:hypothetical protein